MDGGRQQQQFSDDRENVNGGGNFPSQSHRQYYDGCGPTGMPGGMGGNMMGMSRNYNEHSSRNSHGGGSYPPMHMQNGYPGGGGGPEFFRRSNSNGPSNGGQPFPPNNIKMDPSSMSQSKKHHGPMHQQAPHLQEHLPYNSNGPKNSNKPPMLI